MRPISGGSKTEIDSLSMNVPGQFAENRGQHDHFMEN